MEKQQVSDSGWLWFAAFDDSSAYKNLIRSFREKGIYEDGQYLTCPDGVMRMVIEVKKEMIDQMISDLSKGQKVPFIILIKKERDGDFQFLPASKPAPPKRTVSFIEQIFTGSWLLQRQQSATSQPKRG